MLASGHLAALSPSLCLLDTHFLSCILHEAEARGPQLGRFPVSQFKSCFLSLTDSYSFVFVDLVRIPDSMGAGASSQRPLFQDPSGLHSPENPWQILQMLPNRGQTYWNLRN